MTSIGVLPRLQTCFQFIYLFFIYFLRLPRHRRRRRRCHRLRQKTFRLRRDCLPRSRSTGREAPSFLPGVDALHRPWFSVTSKVGSKLSKLTRSWWRKLEISLCRHFSLPWCTPYVNVKLSGACAELKITYQLYGLSIRNPIRKVRIAEPL